MSPSPKLLILCSDPDGRRALDHALERSPLERVFAASIYEARQVVKLQPVALVLCAQDSPDGGFGELRGSPQLAGEQVPVVVASRRGGMTEYLDAMRAGAFDCISVPYRPEELERIIMGALASPHSRSAAA